MSMQYPLVVGGAGGIGRAIALVLASRPEVRRVDIVDRAPLAPIADETAGAEKLAVHRFDLESGDFSFFDRFVQGDTDGLFITAGFGRLALFEELDEAYIERSFTVNSVAPIRIVRRFYGRLLAATPFPCAVMVSIAGFMSSPFFSIYGATKAALKIFIESVNVELERAGSSNRLLNVSPGSIAGTGFSGGATDLKLTTPWRARSLRTPKRATTCSFPAMKRSFVKCSSATTPISEPKDAIPTIINWPPAA